VSGLILGLVLACGGLRSVETPASAMIRYQPADPSNEYASMLIQAVPGGQWDLGLAHASQELLSLATDRGASLNPPAISLAAARAGFPGQARFSKTVNGGAFPADMVDRISEAALHEVSVPSPLAAAGATGTVDLGLAVRTFSDGMSLWIVGWAPHLADPDPIPRDVELDGSLGISVDLDASSRARLFMAPPSGAVVEMELNSGVIRWLDDFHEPGAYRFEVVADRGRQVQVALLFSVFVDSEPPSNSRLTRISVEAPNPHQAEEWMYEAVNRLRAEHGLAPLKRFEVFEGIAREHSALMAASGVVAHVIGGVTPGVPIRAEDYAHPRAQHFENVAAAASAEDALSLVVDSPGHLRNLLCETCTHASIGVALEPVLERRPRVFVTWELLAFPQGAPRPIDHYNR